MCVVVCHSSVIKVQQVAQNTLDCAKLFTCEILFVTGTRRSLVGDLLVASQWCTGSSRYPPRRAETQHRAFHKDIGGTNGHPLLYEIQWGYRKSSEIAPAPILNELQVQSKRDIAKRPF